MDKESMSRTLNSLARVDSHIHDLNRFVGRDNNVLGYTDKQLNLAKSAFLGKYNKRKSGLVVADDEGSLTLSNSLTKRVVDMAKEYHPGDNVMVDEVLANLYDAYFKHKNEKNTKQWFELAYEVFANEYKPDWIQSS